MNNEERFKNFKKLADNNKLSHAYLFFGEPQKEKFDFAMKLAAYLEKDSRILEECFIIAPDEKGIIGIDESKKIGNFLYQKPVLSSKRMVIVKDADSLTFEAQNAVLKIVEDSPKASLIIFITKDESSLLTPLASRLQKIYFPQTLINADLARINADILKMELEEIIEKDKIDEYFESLIAELRKDSVKNEKKLQEVFKRLTAIKMFNVNKKLQIKALNIKIY